MDNKQVNDDIDAAATDPVDRLLQPKKPASSGKGVAVLALLLALAAVAESGWQWWQASTAEPAQATQQESLTRLQTAQQELTRSVGSLKAQLDGLEEPQDPDEFYRLGEQFKTIKSQLDAVLGQSGEHQASMNALQGGVRSLEQRLSATESGLATVAANSQNSNVELDIAEIDYLLRVASERLKLFSDPLAADLALQAADVQVEALNDPMFLSVRQRIATARQALAAVAKIDRVQLSARLSEMQTKIPALPFPGETVAKPEPELPDDAGWWESLKHTLSSLVTVRRRVPEEQAMLSFEDKDYLRQGLWLQLESARLALMRNDAGTYSASLNRVSGTVEQFFQGGSSPVEALLLEVAALEQVDVAPEMPDISAPWIQLRQLRDSRRLLKSATPVASGKSGE